MLMLNLIRFRRVLKIKFLAKLHFEPDCSLAKLGIKYYSLNKEYKDVFCDPLVLFKAGADPGEVKWVNFHPPLYESC